MNKISKLRSILFALTLLMLILFPNYHLRAEVNFNHWPEVEYVMETNIHMFETTVEKLYVGRHAIRIEDENTEILKFAEESVTQIILSDDQTEKTYAVNELSYDEFLNEYGEFASFFAEVMPGQKDGDPEVIKDGEEDYLNRRVEHWYYLENTSNNGGKVDFLLDRELKQILKMVIDDRIFMETTQIEVKKLSPQLFSPPADYKQVSF
jgi:hypothetical protein